MIYNFNNISPKIDKESWFAPNSVLIGNVTLKKDANVWFNATLRGDVEPIIIGEGSNIQDGTIIHVSRSKNGDTNIGKYVTIGHKAIIHACFLEDESFIGMGAIIMDGVVIEKKSMVAAGSVVPPNKVVKEGELWAGVPSKFIRKLRNCKIS